MVGVFEVLAIFATPFGIAALLIGLLMFFAIPLVAAITPFKWPSHMMFALATAPLSRAAVVISESNDALFKAMSYAEPGVEKISLGGEEKSFSDPDAALHWWRGVRFALASEPDGVLFDPRHAAIGKAKAAISEREETSFEATEREWADYDVTKWMPAVYELPSTPTLLNLSHVRKLVDGGEKAEYPKRVESFYKHSQDPFNDGGAAAKFLYPILGFAIPFFGIWVLASQLGTPGAGPSSSVSWSILALLLTRPDPDIDWQRVRRIVMRALRLLLGFILFVAIPSAIFYGLWTFVSPVVAIGLSLAFGVGFLLLPFFSVLVRFSQTLSSAFANLFLKLGFLGYREPVFVWRPEGYELREADQLGDHDVDTWYGLFGSKVGFAYFPDDEPWRDAEQLSPDRVRALGEQAMADGGTMSTDIPERYVRAPSIKRDGTGGIVPKRVRDSAQYLHSAIALNRFGNSADGEKSMERLLLAKEKWGGGSDMVPNKTVLYLTTATTVLGALLGVFFFIA